MIPSYLISYYLPRPLQRPQGWLTNLPRPLESYPMLNFPLTHPREFQYLFLCRSIIIMNQNNKIIRIIVKTDTSIIITEQKNIYKHNTSTHPHPLELQSLFLYMGIVIM